MWRFVRRPVWVDEIVCYLRTLNRKLERIMATQAENQATIDAYAAQAVKAKGEIVAQIEALEKAQSNGQTLDFSGLRTAVGDLDDLNPDAADAGDGTGTETETENGAETGPGGVVGDPAVSEPTV